MGRKSLEDLSREDAPAIEVGHSESRPETATITTRNTVLLIRHIWNVCEGDDVAASWARPQAAVDGLDSGLTETPGPLHWHVSRTAKDIADVLDEVTPMRCGDQTFA